MVLAAIYFTGKDWWWPALGFLVFALFILWRSYRSVPGRTGLRWACTLLKLTGLTALALCLLEPFWSSQKAKPGANYFVVMADNSQGLNIKDPGEARTRGENLRELLTGAPAAWIANLEKTFKVRRYVFDARMQAVRDFGELDFAGRASAMQTALQTVRERNEGRPLAGILLLTDGNATDWADGHLDLEKLPPIYPVVMGRDATARDVSIKKVAVTQTAFEDAPVTLQAEVEATGYAGSPLQLELVAVDSPPPLPETAKSTNAPVDRAASTAGDPVETQKQSVTKSRESLSYRFQVRPERSGVSFYQLRAGALKDKDVLGGESSPEPEEATLANNQRIVVVDRGQGPYRILYVSGRPNWEFKFLNRALTEDDEVRMAALIRMARREPKFEFKGRRGESSNPLYRGFDKKTEETEQYDEAVLIRFNTKDEVELKGGFPKTEEELFDFHALILDDLEAEFFTRDQMTLVQRFVSERGGGLLMLGGPDSFQAGNYQRTPIGDMLPVYLAQTAPPPSANLRWQFTREGWLQPWVRLRGNEDQERARLLEVPAFQVLNPAQEAKPGAMVIATVTDLAGQKYPALAAQRFGHGRTAALLVGDFWRWGLREPSMREDMDRAWRQMVRWLVADVPSRIALEVRPLPNDPNQSVKMEVRVRGQEFHPMDNAQVQLNVQFVEAPSSRLALPSPSGSTEVISAAAPEDVATPPVAPIELTATADPAEAGLYTAMFVPRRTGGYLVTANVTDPKGMILGEDQAGWTSDPAAEEFKSLQPNRALLESIASRTGGEIIEAGDLDSFATGLPDRESPIMEAWSFPLWHQAWVLLFALGCFVAEWGLRRWNGLA